MKKGLVFISALLMVFCIHADSCPNGKAYLEKVVKEKPVDVKQRIILTTQISQMLVHQYPDAAVVCRSSKKQFYCIACPKN